MPTSNQVATSGAALAAPKSRPRFFFRQPVVPGFGLSFGFSLFYLSIIVLLPLSALLIYVSDMTWAQYWRAISHPRVLQSYKVTLGAAFYSTVAATLIGFLIAWITSRYNFYGRRMIDALVDLPFALPTSVAGLTLATLFVPGGWLGQYFAQWGIKISYAYPGILIAMTFTSLPFVVRIVQPVIEELGTEYEEVAQTLGQTAGRFSGVSLCRL